jgi:uncharacterized membrane protein YfcA
MPEDILNLWWGLILLGLCGGVLGGSLGLGSGTLFIPVLVLILAVPQKSAQGTALCVMVPMALIGALRYWHNPDIEVNLKVVGLIIGGALIGVLIGSEIAGKVNGALLRKIFAVYVILVGAKLLIFSPKPADSAQTLGDQNTPSTVTTVIGEYDVSG